VQEAEAMIMRGECGVFSPDLLDCFKLAKQELRHAIETEISYADALI
jgi:putative two-component system response regulator